MSHFLPECLPLAIGSLPHEDAAEACALVLRYLPEVPIWPQLPKRSQLESMYVQYFQRFPGSLSEDGKVVVDRGRVEAELEGLYADYLEQRSEGYALDTRLAAGWTQMRALWQSRSGQYVAVKGQITGPISAGLQITDRDLKPILYDEVLADALGKYLRLMAIEHERGLREACQNTVVFVDEPFLSAVGSGFIQVRRDLAIELLSEVLGGLSGMKGVHCCGNTDWPLLLETPIDVLSFDAYDFTETLALYSADVGAFLKRGGSLAWGIVPTDELILGGEDLDSLSAKLMGGMALLMSKGVDRDMLLSQSWITPACGLAPLTPAGAERALALTAQLSGRIRVQFFRK